MVKYNELEKEMLRKSGLSDVDIAADEKRQRSMERMNAPIRTMSEEELDRYKAHQQRLHEISTRTAPDSYKDRDKNWYYSKTPEYEENQEADKKFKAAQAAYKRSSEIAEKASNKMKNFKPLFEKKARVDKYRRKLAEERKLIEEGDERARQRNKSSLDILNNNDEYKEERERLKILASQRRRRYDNESGAMGIPFGGRGRKPGRVNMTPDEFNDLMDHSDRTRNGEKKTGGETNDYKDRSKTFDMGTPFDINHFDFDGGFIKSKEFDEGGKWDNEERENEKRRDEGRKNEEKPPIRMVPTGGEGKRTGQEPFYPSKNKDPKLREKYEHDRSLEEQIENKIKDTAFEIDYKLDTYFKDRKYDQLVSMGVPVELVEDYNTTYNKVLNANLRYKNGSITKGEHEALIKSLKMELAHKKYAIKAVSEDIKRDKREELRKEAVEQKKLEIMFGKNKPTKQPVPAEFDYRNQMKRVRGRDYMPSSFSLSNQNPAGFSRPNVAVPSFAGYGSPVNIRRDYNVAFARQRIAQRRENEMMEVERKRMALREADQTLQNTFMNMGALSSAISGRGTLPEAHLHNMPSARTPRNKNVNPIARMGQMQIAIPKVNLNLTRGVSLPNRPKGGMITRPKNNQINVADRIAAGIGSMVSPMKQRAQNHKDKIYHSPECAIANICGNVRSTATAHKSHVAEFKNINIGIGSIAGGRTFGMGTPSVKKPKIGKPAVMGSFEIKMPNIQLPNMKKKKTGKK